MIRHSLASITLITQKILACAPLALFGALLSPSASALELDWSGQFRAEYNFIKNYSMDNLGLITFVNAPHSAAYNTTHDLNGHLADIITAEYDFHVPVRLMTDDMKGQIEESNVAAGEPQVSWQAIQMIEVRL